MPGRRDSLAWKTHLGTAIHGEPTHTEGHSGTTSQGPYGKPALSQAGTIGKREMLKVKGQVQGHNAHGCLADLEAESLSSLH